MSSQNYDDYWNYLLKEYEDIKKRDWWDIVCEEEELKLDKKEQIMVTGDEDFFVPSQRKRSKSKSPPKPPKAPSPPKKEQKTIKKEKSIKYSNSFALLNMIDE